MEVENSEFYYILQYVHQGTVPFVEVLMIFLKKNM